MDPQVGTSFIPKQPLTNTPMRGSGFGLIFLIALLIFIASLVAAGAAFLYQQYLQNAIVSKSHSLALAQGAYDPAVIQDLERLDTRINQAEILLKSHIAASGLFAFLSTQTLQNVYFTAFTYELKPDGSVSLTLQGVADSFSTVALQSDQFGNSKYLKDVIFSSIAVAQNGTVTFGVSATVDPSVVSYVNSLGLPAAAASSTQSTDASSTPSTGSGQATQ